MLACPHLSRKNRRADNPRTEISLVPPSGDFVPVRRSLLETGIAVSCIWARGGIVMSAKMLSDVSGAGDRRAALDWQHIEHQAPEL